MSDIESVLRVLQQAAARGEPFAQIVTLPASLPEPEGCVPPLGPAQMVEVRQALDLRGYAVVEEATWAGVTVLTVATTAAGTDGGAPR